MRGDTASFDRHAVAKGATTGGAVEEQQQSLVAFAENEIRKLISSGDVALGERITESDLARRFGMSKTPVREALLHLRQKGLVQVLPRQGTFVFTMTDEEVEQLHGVRTLFEIYALREAVERKRGRLLRDMVDSIARGRKLLATKKVQQYAALDMEFHRLFFLHAGNSFLNAAYNAIEVKIQVLWHLALKIYPGQIEFSIGSHESIVKNIVNGDLDAACDILRMHNRFLYSPDTGTLRTDHNPY